MTRILVIDDHNLVRRKLRELIQTRPDWEVCGEGEDGPEAITKHAALGPQVTVMDYNMPTLNGLQAAREILKDCPSACILMLSISDSSALIEEAKKVGIRGFCSKNAMGSFFEAVEAILRGETYFRGRPN